MVNGVTEVEYSGMINSGNTISHGPTQSMSMSSLANPKILRIEDFADQYDQEIDDEDVTDANDIQFEDEFWKVSDEIDEDVPMEDDGFILNSQGN